MLHGGKRQGKTSMHPGRSSDERSWGWGNLGAPQDHGEEKQPGKEAKPTGFYEKSRQEMQGGQPTALGQVWGHGERSCLGGSPWGGGMGGSTYTMSLSSSRVSGGGLIRT